MSDTPHCAEAQLPAAPASRRRFWVTVLCFAIANALAWAGYHQLTRVRGVGLLKVERFTPGNDATVAGKPAIQWQFNFDVANRGDREAPGTVTPAVAGKWTWPDARTLAFVPDAPVPRATKVTFTLLPDRVRTPEGFSLDKPYTASVKGTPLMIMGAAQVAFEENDRYVLQFTFNDRVLPADLHKRLTLVGPGNVPVKFRGHGEAVGEVLRVVTDPIPGARDVEEPVLRVTIDAGLAGLSGPLAWERPYETTIGLGRTLTATGLDARSPSFEQARLRLRFNSQPDLDALRQVLSIEPPVPYMLAREGSDVSIRGDFKPGTRYAAKLAPAPAGADRARFPKADTFSTFIPDKSRAVTFDHRKGYLGSAGNRTVMARAVNVFELQMTVHRVYDNNIVAWRTARGEYDWSSAEGYGRPLGTKRITLPKEKNKQHDVPVSLDDLLPADAPRDGVYRIAIEPVNEAAHGSYHGGDDDDDYRYSRAGSTSTVVTLSDIGLTAKRGATGLTVWAVSLSTARPLANVRVRAFSSKNQLLGQALTGADGLARLDNINPAPGESADVLLADVIPAEPTPTMDPGRLAWAPLLAILPATAPATRPTAPAAADARPAHLTWLRLSQNDWSLADTDVAGSPYLRTGHEAFAYTERGVYRPGETVHLRAIVRGPDNAPPAQAFPVKVQIRRPDLRDWKSAILMPDADGAIAWDLDLPPDLATGRWSAHIGLPGDAGAEARFFGSASFLVEDYMPVRMKAGLALRSGSAIYSPDDAGARHRVGGTALEAHVQADYLFGRPAAQRQAVLTASLDPVAFAPAQWQEWTFGDAANLAATLGGAAKRGAVPVQGAEASSDAGTATLDDHGHAKWALDLPALTTPDAKTKGASTQPAKARLRYAGPWRLSASASVMEAGGRAVNAYRQLDVDAIDRYVGVRPVGEPARPGQACAFEVAVVGPQGNAVADANGEARVYLLRDSWNNSLVARDGRYQYVSTRVLEPVEGSARTVTLSNGRGAVRVTPPFGGAYVLRVADSKTGHETTLPFYAADGQGGWSDNVSRENPEKLEIALLPATDAATRPATQPAQAGRGAAKFRAGEMARVVVRSPFAGELLLTLETDRVLSTHVVRMDGSSVIVPVEITDACRPNAFVTATVVRAIDPNAKWRVHRAFGVARVNVDLSDRRLAVAVTAPDEARPLRTIGADVRVTDAAGRPVRNAAVTVAAVDEGICMLTGFRTPDPFGFFTAPRALAVATGDLYAQLMPEVPRPDAASAAGGDGEDSSPRHQSPVSAKRVKPVAMVAPIVHTDDAGNARVEFALPEFAGRLRVMAIAHAGPRFGSAERPVIVRSPLLVQSSFPRFAAPGDAFTVPLVLFNNSPAAGDATVTVEMRTPALLSAAGAKDAKLVLPSVHLAAGAQHVVQVPMTAERAIGVAGVRITAAMGVETFEESVEFAIRPASPTISRGGYERANTTSPTTLPIPGGLLAGTESLEVRVTPWPVLELPQGLDYLERYPYGCAEQTTSTCFPLVYLSDIGRQVAPGVFEEHRVRAKVQAGIFRLLGMQCADGGLSMWAGGRETWPWASVYAAHFLVEAKAAGYDVPDDFYRSLLGYVRHLLDRPGDEGDLIEAQAYGCYVLAMAGKPERAVMSRLSELARAKESAANAHSRVQRGQARFYVAAAWLAAGRRDLAAGLVPAVLPAPRDGRQLAGNIGSPVRDRALMVSTLIAVQPDHPSLPALVQQLADAGRRGQWCSTQDTAFAVMALGRYLRYASAQTPYDSATLAEERDAVVQLLARADGGQPLVYAVPATRPALSATTVPARTLRVVLAGPDDAKGHVSWLQTGIPLAPPTDADAGLKVRRRYLTEAGQSIAQNTVRSGDLVQVEITLDSPAMRELLVIEDLLPAGLEIENPRLATAATSHARPDAGAPQFTPSRTDARDDRLVLVGRLTAAGVCKYTYLARAVAPGTFIVPPVRVECMYDLATSSISGAGGTLTVTPAGTPRVVAPATRPAGNVAMRRGGAMN